MKRNTEISSGPFAKARRTDDDSEPMAVDPPSVPASAGRDLSDETLVAVEKIIRIYLEGEKMDNNVKKLDNSTKGTDAAFQNFLSMVHSALFAASFLVGSFPRSFLDSVNQLSPKTIRTNATKQRASGFVDMFKEAVNGNDWRLWGLVVSHGTFIDICFYYRRLISLNL